MTPTIISFFWQKDDFLIVTPDCEVSIAKRLTSSILKGALPHPVSTCVFHIALFVFRAYIGSVNLMLAIEKCVVIRKNSCRKRMWQLDFSQKKLMLRRGQKDAI